MVLHALIPARFLALTAHFVMNVTLFWSRDSNVLSCLPVTYTNQSSQYNTKDIQLIVALSLTLFFTVVEFAGLFSGLSLFTTLPSMFSTTAHVAATVTSSLFVVNNWSCDSYWYIFGFCCLPAFLLEIAVVIATIILKSFK